MQRIKYNSQFNLIRDAISLLPVKVKPFLETVDFVFDYKPIYIGSHFDNSLDDYGRSYQNTCHCNYDYHTSDNKTTIFLFSEVILMQDNKKMDIIWHEIAHAIHERLNFCNYDWIPIWDYEIDTNYTEVFACSFNRWLYKDRDNARWHGNQELQRQYDKRPIEFFNKLFLK